MSIFGDDDPYADASAYLEQIPGTITPYYQPYIDAGTGALNTLQDQYGNLISNPGGFINQVGSGFQSSPGYDYEVDQATQAANNAAASTGMLGTPQEQQQLATTVSGLANQDYYNYLNTALGAYNTGISGESNLANMGYNAASGLAGDLSSNLMNEAGLSVAENQYNDQTLSGALGQAAGIVTGIFT
jgi:hypothetical protein